MPSGRAFKLLQPLRLSCCSTESRHKLSGRAVTSVRYRKFNFRPGNLSTGYKRCRNCTPSWLQLALSNNWCWHARLPNTSRCRLNHFLTVRQAARSADGTHRQCCYDFPAFGAESTSCERKGLLAGELRRWPHAFPRNHPLGLGRRSCIHAVACLGSRAVKHENSAGSAACGRQTAVDAR